MRKASNILYIFSLISIFAFLYSCNSENNNVKNNKLNNKDTVQIKEIKSKKIGPRLSVKEKKQKFIDLMLPIILSVKEEYKQNLDWVKSIEKKKKLSKVEKERLNALMKEFRAKDIKDLEERLVTHPTSIVLAQASIESAWGTSRFFKEANNIFGVWSFNPNDPRIPTKGSRNGKKIYLYKYKSLRESIYDYFKLLATRDVFEQFRKERLKTQDPFVLVNYLDKYSEQGQKYVETLKNQIRHNNFTRYDRYSLEPTPHLEKRNPVKSINHLH